MYRLYRVDVLACSDAASGILPEKRILERRALSLVMKKGKPNRHASFEEFFTEMDELYDLIISNPPFYLPIIKLLKKHATLPVLAMRCLLNNS